MSTTKAGSYVTEYCVAQEDDDMRLDRLCRNRFDLPNVLCQKLCRKGLIRLDTKRCAANDRVSKGQMLQLKTNLAALQSRNEKTDEPRTLTAMQIKRAQDMVLYRDDDVLVLNKPSGLAVQGGSNLKTHIDALLPALQYDAKELPRLVHRLDKDTSGLLLLARHVVAARELQKHFANRQTDKTYLALVSGVPKPLSGTIKTRMRKTKTTDGGGREKMHSGDEGKQAETRYEVIDHVAKTAALVALKPITGRTHQLRVHMADIGCSIVGERKYARRDAVQHLQLKHSGILHLHAAKMVLPACLGKRERTFEVPLPNAMQHSLQQLGLTSDKLSRD